MTWRILLCSERRCLDLIFTINVDALEVAQAVEARYDDTGPTMSMKSILFARAQALINMDKERAKRLGIDEQPQPGPGPKLAGTIIRAIHAGLIGESAIL